MDGKTVVTSYLAFGFFLNTALHTWYVSKAFPRVRFAIPFSEHGAELPPTFGYVGAIVLGLVVFWGTWVYLSAFPPLGDIELLDLLPGLRTGLILVVGLLLGSQFVGGASWSKFALDGLVLLTGLLVFLSYVRLYSFFELVGTYVTLLGLVITLGAVWITQYVEDFQSGTFPSTAYFGICALYLLLGSIYLIFRNALESI